MLGDLTRVKKQRQSATLSTTRRACRCHPGVATPMSQTTHIELIEQLNRNSRPYRDPLTRIDWERLDRESHWLPETALSLHGVDEFEALPEQTHRALSQQEYLHFAGIDTWVKGLFIERLSHNMQSTRCNTALVRYRLHELREQAGHALLFLELQKRAMAVPYKNPAVSSRMLSLLTRYTPVDSLSYQMLMLIGTDLPDRLNRIVRQHRSEICPSVYDIVNLQVVDAMRHITQAREALDTGLQQPHGRRPWMHALVRLAFRRIVALMFYPPAAVYERAGLKPGQDWQRAAQANPERRRFISACVAPTRRLLAQFGFELDWQ
jgi:hypothetical protein